MDMKLLKAALIWLIVTASAFAQENKVFVESVGNQGVLIKTASINVWIDAVYQHTEDWDNFSYKAVAVKYLEQQRTNKAQVFLTTHIHRDHFHPFEMGKLLDKNENSVFIATKQPMESLLESYYNEMRLTEKLILLNYKNSVVVDKSGFESFSVSAYPSVHSHQHYHWVENSVLQVKINEFSLVHLGDIMPDDDVIKLVQSIQDKIDMLVIPYWLLSKADIIAKLNELTHIKKILVSHVPDELEQQVTDYIGSLGAKKIVYF